LYRAAQERWFRSPYPGLLRYSVLLLCHFDGTDVPCSPSGSIAIVAMEPSTPPLKVK
jgi:hypothetical protein